MIHCEDRNWNIYNIMEYNEWNISVRSSFFAENLLEKDVGILLNILNNLIAFALNRFWHRLLLFIIFIYNSN